MDVRELPVDEIVLDPGLNLRDRLDPEAIERYAESCEDLPPVTVFDVDGQWLLADGFHRHAAFIARNRPKIPSKVVEGSYAEALQFAAGANITHGLPLRRQERRRAVEVRLRVDPDRSDRQLARELGVSRDLVARVRHDLVGAGQIGPGEGRVGADGKFYPSPGLGKDPNEVLPGRGDMPPEPRERRPTDEDGDDDGRGRPSGGRDANGPGVADGPPPADGFPPGFPGAELRDLARSGPVPVATPTIDEMLELMARQVMELVCWIEGDDFSPAYAVAGDQARQRFRVAVRTLAEAVETLDQG
ncbi:ParB/RepB/Spo0J family partition protein [Tautonia plasticadhaerens]|uniref:Transcriptional regulator NovG n=1 Tax=Tautonia plasticadhaerens TaxID=2527974 RepID=A0A518H700_9BACT|nr:ParB/RepB/Spo0J family partition protein [Tautonia plasticadhaerens]QDV36564.1 Transcriptional regulator NovG [Tautonia plasticadhaerens]